MKKILCLVVALGCVAGIASAATLDANPPPANNGGSTGWAMFFDLTATAPGITVTELVTASTAAAGANYSVEIFTRSGSALGGPVGSGPGSSPAGWTSLGTAVATQGPLGSTGVSLPIDIPDIMLTMGQTTGVAVQFTGAGPRYFGTGSAPLQTFSDPNLTLVTGDARSAPFTTGGSFFSSRALVGSLTYIPEPASMLLLSLGGLALLRRR